MITITSLSVWLASCLVATLRIAPVVLFAPPFTLTRLPKLVRVWLSMVLAACLISANPEARVADLSPAALLVTSLGEAAIGLMPLVIFQFMFGAIYMVGRTIDIQSGYGLAVVLDPTTRGQTPLVGTLLAYLAGITFFAADGHGELLRLFSASFSILPLGGPAFRGGLQPFLSYVFTMSVISLGLVGAAILVMFLADIVVAMLARTVPQMNALLLGIQVKAILLFLILPLVFGLCGVALAQMAALALRAIPRML